MRLHKTCKPLFNQLFLLLLEKNLTHLTHFSEFLLFYVMHEFVFLLSSYLYFKKSTIFDNCNCNAFAVLLFLL